MWPQASSRPIVARKHEKVSLKYWNDTGARTHTHTHTAVDLNILKKKKKTQPSTMKLKLSSNITYCIISFLKWQNCRKGKEITGCLGLGMGVRTRDCEILQKGIGATLVWWHHGWCPSNDTLLGLDQGVITGGTWLSVWLKITCESAVITK
jgi:hypothetical protein